MCPSIQLSCTITPCLFPSKPFRAYNAPPHNRPSIIPSVFHNSLAKDTCNRNEERDLRRRLSRRRSKRPRRLRPLHGSETFVAQIENLFFTKTCQQRTVIVVSGHHSEKTTYGVNALQEAVPQNVKRHTPSALNAPIHIPIPRVRKRQISLVDRELLVPHRKRHHRQLVLGDSRREDPPLLRFVKVGARDGSVDGHTRLIINEGEGGPRVRDGGVPRARDGFAVHRGGSAVEHPEPLRGVHWCVVGGCHAFSGQHVRVDVPKRVEGHAFRVVGIPPSAQVSSEESLAGLDVVLRDEVFDRGVGRRGRDCVDGAEGQAEEPITGTLGEFCGEGLGELNGLVFDGETTDGNVIRSHRAGRGGAVPV